eukprot:TRINITY_DN15429_c0_g1_i17.p3 TRINITY_DN15429_c0_g1~~TRINITY_DN15429_c0_g1_i17.p3  ORF type:complete len:114 (-),score=46.91 TRINITY_DN15429_c0_g1_i17:23-364(-)
MVSTLPFSDPQFLQQFNTFCSGKFIVKLVDMPEEMASEAKETIITGIDKNTSESKIDMETACRQIKEAMDAKYGASWHCIIGLGFAYDITSNKENLLYGYLSLIHICRCRRAI